MNNNTSFTYTNSIGTLEFSLASPYWITNVTGAAGVGATINETQNLNCEGTSIIGRSVAARTIVLDGCIFEPLLHTRAKLVDVFAPGVPSVLSLTDGGKTWLLDVEVKNGLEVSLGSGVQNFQVGLHAASPYWRSLGSYSQQLMGLRAALRFPAHFGGSWYLSRFSQGFYAQAENTGNIPIGFQLVLTARAAVTNPEIVLLETGQCIRFETAMQNGDSIMLQTHSENLSATYAHSSGVQTSAYIYMDAQSDMRMQLLPGKNTFKVSAAEGRENLSVRLVASEGVKSGA